MSKQSHRESTGKILLGISACLIGYNVRYDGGNTLDRYLRDSLGKYVDYVPVCPEAECRLGIPREKMRLYGDATRPRLITVDTKIDHTEKMKIWAKARVTRLKIDNIGGFIFKSKSPSCGMEQVKVYDDRDIPQEIGTGIFARLFIEYLPALPVMEERNLSDSVLLKDFLTRIFGGTPPPPLLTKIAL